MRQGVCVDPGLSTVLRKGQTYYLFDHGINNFYVSNFPRPGSHCGSFQRRYFELIIEKPARLKRFIARVNRPRNGYIIGDEYIITEVGENGYFHVYTKKRADKGPIGSYLSDFFEVIGPYEEAEMVDAVKKPQKVAKRLIDPIGTITLPDEQERQDVPEDVPIINIVGMTFKKDKPKKEKVKKLNEAEKLEAAGQLNLFDFL